MIKTLENVGQLKRTLDVEIPLEDIKPSYNKIFSKLKSIRLPGFRPGKFPAGWIKKRFSEQMTHEASDQLIPNYFNKIVDEMKLRPATRAEITELSFDSKKPLKFKLNFEVAPELELPDYSKIDLEKKESEVSEQELGQAVLQHRQNVATYEEKAEGSVIAEGDSVTVDYSRTIGDKVEEEADQKISMDERVLTQIRENLMGLSVGDNKEFSFEITEDYIKDEVGNTATFNITVKKIESTLLPPMDEEFFKNYNDVESEEDFNKYVENQLLTEKNNGVRYGYHEEVRKQLIGLYDEFELPEKILSDQEKQIDERIKKDNPDISDDDLAAKKAEELKTGIERLRTNFIIQQVATTESLKPDEDAIHQRFAMMAQMYGIQPQDAYQSEAGYMIYQQATAQMSDEVVLDHIVEKVIGPLNPSETNEPEALPEAMAEVSASTEV